jgi:hypothetical protein
MVSLHTVGSLLLIVVDNVSSMPGSYTHMRAYMCGVPLTASTQLNSLQSREHDADNGYSSGGGANNDDNDPDLDVERNGRCPIL